MAEETLTSIFINQLTTLKNMRQQYESKIAESPTDTNSVMALQDELEIVAGLIFETTQILQEIRHASLTKSRELLKLIPNDPRYNEKDAKLKVLGYGGRKTRRRKSRR